MSKNIIFDDIDINPLLNAVKILDEGINIASSELEKAGTIQSFKICYELTWKIMKRILKSNKIPT